MTTTNTTATNTTTPDTTTPDTATPDTATPGATTPSPQYDAVMAEKTPDKPTTTKDIEASFNTLQPSPYGDFCWASHLLLLIASLITPVYVWLHAQQVIERQHLICHHGNMRAVLEVLPAPSMAQLVMNLCLSKAVPRRFLHRPQRLHFFAYLLSTFAGLTFSFIALEYYTAVCGD